METSELAKLDADLRRVADQHRQANGTDIAPAVAAEIVHAHLGTEHPLVQSAAATFIRERAAQLFGV